MFLRDHLKSRSVGPRPSEKVEAKAGEAGDAGGAIVDAAQRRHRLSQPAEARMDF